MCACSSGAPSLVAGVDEPQPITEPQPAGRTLMGRSNSDTAARPSAQFGLTQKKEEEEEEEEEEEGFYKLRPVNKTDHMRQDIKVLTKH